MPATITPSDVRRSLARRVADAHVAALEGASLMALVSGSTVEDLADERSDIDMSIVVEQLPGAQALQAACAGAGAAPWHWTAGTLAEGGLVVAFKLDGIEVQIAYSDHATLQRELDQVLLQHDPDTPLHKLCEGLAKAEPLAGGARLAALQARIAAFPPALGRAMSAHFLGQSTPWRAMAQIVHRDALPWGRELQVQCTWRLLGALAGLNGVYFTTFQCKRTSKLVASFASAPTEFAARLDAALGAPLAEGFAALHALEAEVIGLVQARWPDLDLAEVRRRHAGW